MYEQLAAEQGVLEDCLFTGQVSQKMARRLLGHASVLISPRTEGTNTPLKVYEYLLSGLPIVATRVPSHTQVLSEEVCFLAEPHAEGLAAALETALTDTHARQARVEAARDLYLRRYSREVYTTKMSQLLQRLR